MKGWYLMKTTRNTETSRSNDSFPSSGLCLSGTISQRTKRLVPANNPTTEIVTYTVTDDDGHLHYVDDYSPSEYHNIGDKVHIPIFIKAYKKKSGDAAYSLNVLKPFTPTTKGEAF